MARVEIRGSRKNLAKAKIIVTSEKGLMDLEFYETIQRVFDIAEKNEGLEIVDSNDYPKRKHKEKVAASFQLIFPDYLCFQNFVVELK